MLKPVWKYAIGCFFDDTALHSDSLLAGRQAQHWVSCDLFCFQQKSGVWATVSKLPDSTQLSDLAARHDDTSRLSAIFSNDTEWAVIGKICKHIVPFSNKLAQSKKKPVNLCFFHVCWGSDLVGRYEGIQGIQWWSEGTVSCQGDKSAWDRPVCFGSGSHLCHQGGRS